MGEDVMVQGTPTVFVNGEKDSSRQKKYETLGKKIKFKKRREENMEN